MVSLLLATFARGFYRAIPTSSETTSLQMISTRFTSDVWKAYLFAADVIAARYSEYLHRRKSTAACMGPANTASPGTIEYDPKTTTMRARMGAHRTSVVVFAPCISTSRYWYARR